MERLIVEQQQPLSSGQIALHLKEVCGLRVSRPLLCGYLKEVVGVTYKTVAGVDTSKNLRNNKLRR